MVFLGLAMPVAAHLWPVAMLWVMPLLWLAVIGLDAACGTADGVAAAATTAAVSGVDVPRLYIPLQLATIVWGAHAAGAARPVVLLSLILSSGLASGIFGMLCAHEMIHRRHRGDRALGLAMLVAVSYPHFAIAHIRGHHRRGGSLADPATARRGESAYRFICRSVVGQIAESWSFERRRTTHRLPLYAAIVCALYLSLALSLGRGAVWFEAGQSAVAIVILELFNYVAHYGLLRGRRGDGRLEQFGPHHAWNAPQRLNNHLLLDGGHHSAHHLAPSRPHHRLGPWRGAPRLPLGYAGCILLALMPPLWRRVIEPRFAAAAGGSGSCAGGLAQSGRTAYVAADK
jgi:alkane 1-monooxygenase